MYKRPRFIEILHEIRQEMAAEADYDLILFAEMIRSGEASGSGRTHSLVEERASVQRKAGREIERAAE
jgi:hypothetical protein